jgi:hypothetical protein
MLSIILIMQYKLHSLLAASLLIGSLGATAQTTSTFEGSLLPGADTTYLETQIPNGDGVYTFESGNALFYGNITWGSFWGNFNYSNHTDTVVSGTGNNITGSGYDGSSQFAIAYVPIDFMNTANPTATIPVGTKLQGAAAGKHVLGTYVTNSVYAYRYILNNDFYANNNYWFKLVVRGYLNGAKTTDSVVFTLADYTNTASPVLVNKWEWVDLTPLGQVDSVTFDLASNDTLGGFGINTPAYFAIDNFITSDGFCPKPQNIAAVSVNENSATITWESSFDGFTTTYEVAVDQSATLAPTATVTQVPTGTYSAASLTPNTQYYAHVRSACDDGGFSDWDTAEFKTLTGTGIFNTEHNGIHFSISPNPATEVLHIAAGAAVNAVVYSIEGRPLISAEKTKTINVASLPAGVYLLKVTDVEGKQTGTLRFTKQH